MQNGAKLKLAVLICLIILTADGILFLLEEAGIIISILYLIRDLGLLF